MRYKKILIYTLILFVVIPGIGIGSILAYNYFNYPRQLAITTLDMDNDSAEVRKQQAQFWIGDIGPVGYGKKQYPFICTVIKFGLGQPIIDSEKPGGYAVFPEFLGYPLMMLDPIGYSNNCSIATRVDYFYFSKKQQKFIAMLSAADRNTDIEYIELEADATTDSEPSKIPFIVRLERGTINRFIYGIAMLAPYAESLENASTLNNTAWNKKLVYKFQGGIGIGRYQGGFSLNKRQALHYASLKRGYAVAYSSGTRTATHYDLNRAEKTALMVKQHFIETYGTPMYTVGVGASGGGIQQYIIAQNNKHIIDAAIPQASFPDMITESMSVADCELLERFFDSEYENNTQSYWGNWLNRQKVQGVTANQTAVVEKWQRSPAPKPGGSECMSGWRGTFPNIFNPQWTHPLYKKVLEMFKFPEHTFEQVKWTHWNDLFEIYPVDANGYAANSWDNIGIQYGLLALRRGDISKQQFLDLNACVGGWKQPAEMRKGDYPWDQEASQNQFDTWDQANMNLSKDCKAGNPAPRTRGSSLSVKLAHQSGHVFRGDIDIPVIDIRWYLEPILNIHHLRGSFSTRARIQAYKGNYQNQVIWVSACSDLNVTTLKSSCSYESTADALDVMDDWMQRQRKNPTGSIVQNRPAKATDTCAAADGSVLYSGVDAWDGILNKKPQGPCSQRFKIYTSSRMEAGEDIKGLIFQCALIPIERFVKEYGYKTDFNSQELARMRRIFPEGVCDYNKPDRGLSGFAG
ncbi:MAG: DUF6351 family protein [Thiohalomonadales bacterium]